jgi:hypothetical protein
MAGIDADARHGFAVQVDASHIGIFPSRLQRTEASCRLSTTVAFYSAF